MSAFLSAAERIRFEEEVRLFQEGLRSEEEFRNVRVPMGIYEQRERGKYMMRIRVPAGRLTSAQLSVIADAAHRHGSGDIHLTTRQDVQIHNIPVAHIVPALRRILPFGLITKGGGGNTIRNITACVGCDLCGDSVCNVEPYARRLNARLLVEEDSFRLPRKFKIAFSGCASDCSEAGVADVGFIARVDRKNGGEIGFQVLVGGGLGARSYPAFELEPFIPAEEAYLTVSAIREIYRRHGNYRDKTHSRLRFMVQDMGIERFKDLYFSEKEIMRDDLLWPLVPLRELESHPNDPSDLAPSKDPEFTAWKKINVAEQKRRGFYAVTVPALMGDFRSDKAAALGEFLWDCALDELRVTHQQNFLIPNVPGKFVPNLYEHLKNTSLASTLSKPLAGLSVCAGAGTCQLGICRSKDVAMEIMKLSNRAYWSHPAFRQLSIRVSGCHNNCARPAAAVLGLIGVARTKDNMSYPAYQVLWGGRIRGTDSVLAEPLGTAPARWVAVLIDGFLERLAAILPRDTDIGKLIRTGKPILRACLSEFQEVPTQQIDPLIYQDWGKADPFTTEDRGQGECSAG